MEFLKRTVVPAMAVFLLLSGVGIVLVRPGHSQESNGGAIRRLLGGGAERDSDARSLARLAEQFRLFDVNGDKKLSRDELEPELFSYFNVNDDDHITLDEARQVVTKNGAAAVEAEIKRVRAKAAGTSSSPANAENKDGTSGLQTDIRQAPKRVAPGENKVGQMIVDWTAFNLEGKPIRLSELMKSKILVVAFTNTTCPISKKYAPTLASIEDRFRERGVSFVYVNPSEADKLDAIRATISQHGLDGAYLRDRSGLVATAMGATHTTDVMVLDAKRTLVYRGAVDDQYGLGYTKDEPRETFLVNAIEAVLQNDRLSVSATLAPGCPLELPREATDLPRIDVTYHNRISRIVQNHCLTCHREGGVAPFSLSSYEEVASQAAPIRQAIERGIMPPWFAAKPPKNSASPFVNDCSMAESDKAAFLSWLDTNKPEGDPADAPLPRAFVAGWQIGKPDHVVQLPTALSVKATGTMAYQNVIVSSELTETKYVTAVEVKPTAREVVHHILVFVLPPAKNSDSTGGKQSDNGDEDETTGFFAAYAPGYDALQFQEGYGKVLPAGSRLKFQIHYTPNGTATTDQPMIGMVFAKSKPSHLVSVTGIAQPRFSIPPGDDNHQVVATRPVPRDATIMAFFPHMHLRGKAFRYEVVHPDGHADLLLDIPRYDFNWQLSYRLTEPYRVPAGSTIRATAWYDNSDKNPANPDATKTVRWGPQTFDEMMIGYVEYHMDGGTLDRAGRLLGLASDIDFDALFTRLDKNNDGSLDQEELPQRGRDRLMQLDGNGDGLITRAEFLRLKK